MSSDTDSMSPHEKNKRISSLEKMARGGDVRAMNILHLYDLKRAGHKAVNLDIPAQYGHRIKTYAELMSYCSSTAGW